MEEKRLDEVSEEALEASKQQKSRNRFFGLLVIINLALLGIFIYEVIVLAMSASGNATTELLWLNW